MGSFGGARRSTAGRDHPERRRGWIMRKKTVNHASSNGTRRRAGHLVPGIVAEEEQEGDEDGEDGDGTFRGGGQGGVGGGIGGGGGWAIRSPVSPLTIGNTSSSLGTRDGSVCVDLKRLIRPSGRSAVRESCPQWRPMFQSLPYPATCSRVYFSKTTTLMPC